MNKICLNKKLFKESAYNCKRSCAHKVPTTLGSLLSLERRIAEYLVSSPFFKKASKKAGDNKVLELTYITIRQSTARSPSEIFFS